MNKLDILNTINNKKLIAVIRGDSIEEAINKANACVDGGIEILEITFTVPNADQAIKHLCESLPNHYIGAGTVLDGQTARIALLAGAQFIVGPNFNKDVADLCNSYNVPYIAGCMTINEMIEAKSFGVDIIKLFPGSTYGPNFIKSVKDPLPFLDIIPTGGVNLDNCTDWLENGAMAVGIGGNLTTGSYEDIRDKSSAYTKAIKFFMENNK